MLLRGGDTFFLRCPHDESGEEAALLHQVYAASLEFKDFLDRGTPVTFEVPGEPGPVVSALKLGDRLLVRRTDFTDERNAISLKIDEREILVPRLDGRVQILGLP